MAASATDSQALAQPRVSDRVLTVPNALSLLRLVLVPVFAWFLAAHHDGAALSVLAISGISDYLDGKLARRWGQISRVGQVLDPFADRLYIVSTLAGLAWREIIPWWLVVALVGRDALLLFALPMLARAGYGPPPVHFLGKAATFNLLYAFPLLLLAQGDSTVAEVARPIAWAFAWWGTALYWWAGWLYVRQGYALVRAAPEAATREDCSPRRPRH